MYRDNGILSMETSAIGARIISLTKNGKDFIFPQQFVGKVKGINVIRGGMHPCSPIFGKKDGQFAAIPQHGGLRDIDWRLVNATDDDGIEYQCEFKQFDYWLVYSVHYRLVSNCLRVITRIENKLSVPVPLEFGWHPYFFAPEGAKISFSLHPENRPIFVDQPYSPQIFETSKTIKINLVGVGRVRLYTLQGFATGRVCIWTDWRKEYVCVEPLLSHPDDFNTQEGIFLDEGHLVVSLAMCFD